MTLTAGLLDGGLAAGGFNKAPPTGRLIGWIKPCRDVKVDEKVDESVQITVSKQSSD